MKGVYPMGLPENRQLKAAAKESILRSACAPGKLVALHTAVILVISLLTLVVDLVLERQIGNTGGLSGVGTRSVLETVRTVLQYAQLIALPFWQVGWIYATLKIARGEDAEKKDLLEGFRKFFPFLRLTVLKSLIFTGLALGAVYVAAWIITMFPFANSTLDLADPNLTAEALIAAVEPLIVPAAVLSGILALGLCLPFFYRFRMAEYCLLEDPKAGARAALRRSGMLMRGNKRKLLQLDVSFWWFWLMAVAVSVLGWADVLLPWMGIELPWTAEVSCFIAYLLAAAVQLALYYFCKPYLDVTYAHAYLALLPKEEDSYESH